MFTDGHYVVTTPGLATNAEMSNSPPFGRAATQSYTPREYLNLYSKYQIAKDHYIPFTVLDGKYVV